MKVPGVAPTLERINQVNREYIREPLTTVSLVMGDITSGREPVTGFFDPQVYAKAYKGAQDISFGQATVSFIETFTTQSLMFTTQSNASKHLRIALGAKPFQVVLM